MSVCNVLSSYAVNTSMQYNNASSLISKTEAQFKITSQSSSSGDAVLDYYHNLCSNFPDMSFRLSDKEEELKHMNDRRPYFGYNDSLNQVGDNYSELGQISIDIDVAVIRKMQNDPSFEEEVLATIENIKTYHVAYQQEAINSGMPYMDYCLQLEGDELQKSQGYYSSKYSTEEELRRMWDAEEYQRKMGQYFEEQKAELIEIYLKMTESCILKKDELAPSEQSKEEQRIENISKATQQVEDEYEYAISKHEKIERVDIADVLNDRKGIGLTSFPVSSMTSALVGAYIPKESTEQDPIIQVDYKVNGERHVYNIHVNDVDPTNASDMEMFAYLTYQGYIGNKIPGAINNWSAYKTIRREDDLDTYGEFQQLLGEKYFTSTKSNAIAMIERVYSWMKNINHSDAKVQAGWCEDLLAMLNPVNDTLENYV
ncbi:MAG: hypothetical protein IKW81_01935 [Pseudobutyrivibrio sp.]|nr:hypothetical protein [Pseudobutyrivibrio sp.]